jgi:hypothetical protein
VIAPSRILRGDNHGDFLPEHSPNRIGALTTEWLALLECASPYPDVQRLGELIAKPMDWPQLMALADEHGMLPLLAGRLRDVDDAVVPAEIRRKLREWQRAQIIFTLSLTAELFRLLDRFAASGIEVLLTKGPALAARCYGDPGSRQYTDLDLIVCGSDIQRSTEAMIALGYEPKVPLKAIQAKKFPGEYVFAQRDTGLLVEFHTEHTFRYHPRPLVVERLFERRACVRFDGHEVPALSTEDELILICIHGAKHFWTRLMWIADVAALASRQDVDWDRAMSAGREVGAERMLRVGMQLAADVLGVRLPAKVASDVRSDATAEDVAAQIAHRLPLGDSAPFGLFGRAAFRMRMRGGVLRGAAYLLRLSLSPTEEDWVSGSEDKRSWLLDAVGRPFRLARKYGRDGRL